MIRIMWKEDIEAIKFCAAAVGKQESPPDKYLCIRDNKVIGTNGHRLHRAPLRETAVDDGLYEIVKNTKKECIIERVKDDGAYYSQETIERLLTPAGREVEVQRGHLAAIMVYLAGKNNQALDPVYILDACTPMQSTPFYTVVVTLPEDPNSAIHFKQKGSSMEALIMPVGVDDNLRRVMETSKDNVEVEAV